MKFTPLLLLLIPCLASAQRDWSAVEIKTLPINSRIAYLVGSGGNVGVLHGPEGLMLVDDQYAPLSGKIQVAATGLTDSEIRFVVNTHYHGDHTGGNENFKVGGAVVVAHENVKSRLAKTFENTLLGRTMEAKDESFWPVVTFSQDITFYLNGEEVHIVHVKNAHTDGDALVHFKTSNILHTGDAFVRYGYPYVDVSAGGTIHGMIAAQKQILALCDEDTRIIPGHGELATAEDVRELLKMLEETKEIIATAKVAGETLEDLRARKPLESYHERWSGNFISSDLFTQIIYETL